MENAERVLSRGNIVAQHQIKLKFTVCLSCYRGYCVVGRAVGFGKYKGVGVGISAPAGKYFVGKLN